MKKSIAIALLAIMAVSLCFANGSKETESTETKKTVIHFIKTTSNGRVRVIASGLQIHC